MSRPRGGVGVVDMLIDAWLFAKAFTVNTKKHRKEKKKTTKRANEEAVRVNSQNDAKPQQILLLRSSNTDPSKTRDLNNRLIPGST